MASTRKPNDRCPGKSQNAQVAEAKLGRALLDSLGLLTTLNPQVLGQVLPHLQRTMKDLPAWRAVIGARVDEASEPLGIGHMRHFSHNLKAS